MKSDCNHERYQPIANLKVADVLYRFVRNEVLPGLYIDELQFWGGFSNLVTELSDDNRKLLRKRDELQYQIDNWHKAHRGAAFSHAEYKEFLKDIAYLAPEVDDFCITTENVDAEIATQAGPQLVVPVKNARFALNAANARWGSLYDAAYGTDVITDRHGAERSEIYNPVRGKKVVEYGRDFLDRAAPLDKGSHRQATHYHVFDRNLLVEMEDGTTSMLQDKHKFAGFTGSSDNPGGILLRNNGLHLEIQIDRTSAIGRTDDAGVKDILVEAALTTIMDCEDSVAAVDAEDKVEVYRNWLGLMQGTLETSFHKKGRIVPRKLNPDRSYQGADGKLVQLHGRSLLLIRNVGHLMMTDAILDSKGQEIPEGVMDAVLTSLIALHDLQVSADRTPTDKSVVNSRTGSVYIVKPKMHGPEEVAFTVALFTGVEKLLGLKPNTIKLGIMDEERRTTVNLKACIKAAQARTVFINTGFLDRTGDEIHTSMHAGAVVPKTAMKQQPWIDAYERWNVDIGLACGLPGRAQIGKGMWPMPDRMADMMTTKVAHPQAGANTAWVPSPNAATLHAMHYHTINVAEEQEKIRQRTPARLDDILTPPLLADPASLSDAEIQAELDNNCQGILGYVVRWINQGIGCSKVPDINDIGLMEDRATLRISSQHIANWLLHGICSAQQVTDTLLRMAATVDQQNVADPDYQPMAKNPEQSLALKAATDLIFKGAEQPNGYTEPLLHAYRRQAKQVAQSQQQQKFAVGNR